MAKRLRNCLLFILRIFYWRNKAARKLASLLPDFYDVFIDKQRNFGIFKITELLDELKKVSTWHSNFLGLIEPWSSDAEFSKIFERAAQTLGIHVSRCFMLYQFLRQIDNLDGDIAEIGVYKGRSAKLMALTVEKSPRNVYLFDTFSGMPEVNPEKDNFYQEGAFGDTSLAEVTNFLSDCQNVTIYPGFFPDTAEPITDKEFAFVHIDVDIYRSVLGCCKFFYPRMVSSGIMVFDDPGFADCAGAKLAVDEYFADKEDLPVYLATGQVLVIKK